MEGQSYRSCFSFNYGFLDDQTIWIESPLKRIFRIDRFTLQVILDLNTGKTIDGICKKYDLSKEEVTGLIQKFNKEGTIVDPKLGKIAYSQAQEDISLSGYLLLFCFLVLLQLEYFRVYARTYLLARWQEGIFIAAIAIGAIFFHELGHYLFAKRYFKFRPKFGFTFSFIFPAIYVDTHEAWRLPRNKRILINSAGLLSDFLVNVAAVALAVNYRHLEYFVTPFLLIQYTRLSMIINPLFPTDGYWILSDLTKTVNLGKVGLHNLARIKFNFYSLYGLLSFLFALMSMVGLIWFSFNLLHNLAKRFF